MTDVLVNQIPASILRRLAATGYDLLLLAALWFLTTGILVPLYVACGLPTEDINGVVRPPVWFLQRVLLPILIVETWGFYAWFWRRGGQTLGMRAWRIRAHDPFGMALSLQQTVLRFLAGMLTWLTLGLGLLLVLLPPHQALHDRLSGTRTTVLPKPEKPDKGSKTK